MPILCLTDKTVRSIPLPEKGQTLYCDTLLTGFALRVSQGGATIHPLAQGVWLEDGLLISETVRMVACFMPQSVLDRSASTLYALVQTFAQETQQSTVGVEIDGTFYIVPALSKETHLC